MIRKSPCERYIKFLLVHPDKYSVDSIRDIVLGQGLDYPSDDYVGRLADRLLPRVPKPFRPTQREHYRSYKFLSREQILGLFQPDDSSLLALKMLEQPRAKEMIESMTLAGEGMSFTSHRVKALGLKCTPKAVKRYCHFYWDLSLVDATETRALLRMRTDRLGVSRDGMELSRDQRIQHQALRRASYKDPRRIIAETPITPIANMLNQMRLGLMPSQADLSRMAHAARLAAVGRVYEAAVDGGPDCAAHARDFGLVTKIMSELIEDVGDPDIEFQKELQQLSLKTEDGHVAHIDQLAEGDTYTVDMAPLLTDKEEDVVDTD